MEFFLEACGSINSMASIPAWLFVHDLPTQLQRLKTWKRETRGQISQSVRPKNNKYLAELEMGSAVLVEEMGEMVEKEMDGLLVGRMPRKLYSTERGGGFYLLTLVSACWITVSRWGQIMLSMQDIYDSAFIDFMSEQLIFLLWLCFYCNLYSLRLLVEYIPRSTSYLWNCRDPTFS